MDTIFVKIASYRDIELPKTILSALRQASAPERLVFGICWQYDETSMLDLDRFVESHQFRIHQTYYENSKGCCWARHQTDQLYDGEKYMLQIDAHTRFAPNWDSRFITMLESLDSDKALLSTYPAPFEYLDGEEKLHTDRGIQRLALNSIKRDLTTVFCSKPVSETSTPLPSKFIGAGQIFTYGQFCEEVMYDPNLYFVGEEISLSARAYTHGYDFYCPNEDLLWHLYHHSMPLHSRDHSKNQNSSAVTRLNQLLLGDQNKLGRYGLGSTRSLADFEQYCDINFKQTAERKAVETRIKTRLELDLTSIEDRDDYDYWIFTLRNGDDEELYRLDLFGNDIPARGQPFLEIDVELNDTPVSYCILPHSRYEGYLARCCQTLALPG